VKRGLAGVLLLFAAAKLTAAELTPMLQEGQIGAVFENVAYPPSLSKDLKSGLTNRILIRVSLVEGSIVHRRRAVEIALRYDLWDEHFVATMTLDGAIAEARTIGTMEEAMALLRRLSILHLFEARAVAPDRPLVLQAEVLFNPLDRERMEMIRKWVTENSVGPSDVGGRTPSDNMSVAIFNRIFEQYAKGADVAAAWRDSAASRPFTLNELANRGR
jgi:hypothetical protein